jgi:hypothetical protein
VSAFCTSHDRTGRAPFWRSVLTCVLALVVSLSLLFTHHAGSCAAYATDIEYSVASDSSGQLPDHGLPVHNNCVCCPCVTALPAEVQTSSFAHEAAAHRSGPMTERLRSSLAAVPFKPPRA